MPDPTIAPPPSVEIDEGSFDSALSASAPQIGNPAGAVPAAPVEQPKPDPTPEPEKPAEVKPADAPKKKGLDALSEEKSDEKPKDKEEAKPTEADEPEVDTSKWAKAQQEAFASARVAGKRLKEQVKETQTRYEKLQKEFEAYKSQPRDSEATQKELQRLKNWESAQELKTTPEWVNTFEKPLQASLAVLGKIAARAKVDSSKLEAATDIEDELDRYDAVVALFEAADAPVPAHLVQAAIDEAKKLHPLYAKGAELEKKAGEALSSLKHQTEQQKAESAKAAEAEYTKHHDHIYGQLTTKMKSLLADEAVAADVKAARPATDPADQAFQAQAAAILPTLWEKYLAVRDEAAREKSAKLALLNTRSGVTPSTTPATKPANGDDVELDEDGLGAALNTMRGGR